jgi:diguanylate cyclase (GGDEF)-like protein
MASQPISGLSRRATALLACGVLLLTALQVMGIAHLQRARIRSQQTARLALQVDHQVDTLYAAVGHVLEAARTSRAPVPRTLLNDAAQDRQALERALTALERNGSGDRLEKAATQRARTFVVIVRVNLQEVAAAGARGQEQAATSARAVLDPLHKRLQADVEAQVASAQAIAVAADRKAIWGSAGLTVALTLMLMVVAWWGTRTRARAVHEATASAARRFESLISNLSDVITVLDADGRITYQSPSLSACTGDRADTLTDLLHPDDAGLLAAMVADPGWASLRPVELRLRHADRTYHWWETRLTNLLADPSVHGLVLTSRDVTERRALEARLAGMAYHDSLTGLGNRAMLHRHLAALSHRPASPSRRLTPAGTLFFLDLDDFTSVNDTLGHGIGDRVLQVIADRLRGEDRSRGLVTRLGGDEFALVVGSDEPAVTEPLADRILAALARPITIGDHDILLTASMGLAPILLPPAGPCPPEPEPQPGPPEPEPQPGPPEPAPQPGPPEPAPQPCPPEPEPQPGPPEPAPQPGPPEPAPQPCPPEPAPQPGPPEPGPGTAVEPEIGVKAAGPLVLSRVRLPDAAEPTGWAEDVLRRADLALYAAKTSGRGRWERFDPAMEERTRQQVELQQSLREAIRREQFAVHYQPVVDLVTGRICSLEALVRWHHDGAVIGPDHFIHVAEDSGLIIEIGSWVLHRACRDLTALHRLVPATAGISVAVNVSGRQLVEPSLVDEVLTALDEAGLDPRHLVVEVTETLLTEHPERTSDMLDALRARGIKVAVDDFGTGYSSLSRLTDLPVDIVKIDRSFIRPLTGVAGSRNTAIVSAIITLANALTLQTVAEGVETPQQLTLLRNRACSHVQGFLFARPLPFPELTDLLASTPSW